MDITHRKKIGCVVGTRPELIKMAPLIHELNHQPHWTDAIVINTAQHRELLDPMFELFKIKADYDLNVMTPGQSLGVLTAHLCTQLEELFEIHHFDALLAAGDTNTVFITALMAFYYQIPFGHVEAGLRTHIPNSPFPEEMNRRLTAPLARWHFVPTQLERLNLTRENIDPSDIYLTGNPVIDSLYWILEHTQNQHGFTVNKTILVTMHRRENFGLPIKHVCQAILSLIQRYPDLTFIIPVHPNPDVKSTITQFLGKTPQIQLIEPLNYDDMVHLMKDCFLIMTDSGGLQEEAPALAKPVIVLRESTERTEVIEQELGILAGTNTQSIIDAVVRLLDEPALYQHMARKKSPYGDGHAAERIVNIIQERLCASE